MLGNAQARLHGVGHPPDERGAEAVTEPSADDHRLHVQGVLSVGEGDAERVDRLVDQRSRELVALVQGVRDDGAGHPVPSLALHDVEQHGAGALALLATGGTLDAEPAGVGLEAAAPAAGALTTTVLHDRVADLPGAAPPAAELPAKDDAASHTRAYEDSQQVLVRAPGAAVELPHRGDAYVVVHRDGYATERLRHRRAERDIPHEPGHVGGHRHVPVGRDAAGRTDADGRHHAQGGRRGGDGGRRRRGRDRWRRG